jgi:hypothetical protein
MGKRLTLKKVNDLIKDERMAKKEYAEFAKRNPGFYKLSHDEGSHHDFLMRLKEDMLERKQKRKT